MLLNCRSMISLRVDICTRYFLGRGSHFGGFRRHAIGREVTRRGPNLTVDQTVVAGYLKCCCVGAVQLQSRLVTEAA